MQEYDDEEIEEASRIKAEIELNEQERESAWAYLHETEQRQEPPGPARAQNEARVMTNIVQAANRRNAQKQVQHDRPNSESDSSRREPPRELRQEVLGRHCAGMEFSSDRGEPTPDSVRDSLMKDYPAEAADDEGSGKYTLNWEDYKKTKTYADLCKSFW